MEQKEIFIINDVTLDINPSDIKLIEDNYVTQESFLRTKSVAAYRSRYAASKIIVTIPVEIDDITFAGELKYEELPGILKVIVQLDTYPFCFIKSSRVQTYISPTSVSSTGFLMFAVDELNIHCKSELSNIVFLELSLIYFNHAPLVKDFKFKKTVNLETYADASDFKYKTDPQPFGQGVNSLSESLSWSRYFESIIDDLKANLDRYDFKLSETGVGAAIDGLFNSLRVEIGVPVVQTIDSTSYTTGALASVGKNSKIVRSFNPRPDVLETILSGKEAGQQFTKDKDNPEHPTYIPADETKKELSLEETLKILKSSGDSKEEFFKNSRLFLIDYVQVPLIEYNTVVQSIIYRKKNKLAINHIGSLKHPVIQYLGKYPTEVVIQFTADVKNEYKDISSVGASAILKEKLNIVDYNKTYFPEVTAYNNIKILSLPTFLTNNLTYLPNQFHINSSAEQQGIESFTCTFVENDLREFLQIGDVVNSGKNSSGLAADFEHKVLLKFCEELDSLIKDPNVSKEEKLKYANIIALLQKLGAYIQYEFGGPAPDITAPIPVVFAANAVAPYTPFVDSSSIEQMYITTKLLASKLPIATLIKGRQQVVTGSLGNVPEKFKGRSFSESYEANVLIKKIIAEIIKEAQNGLSLCINTISSFEEDMFDQIYQTSYAFNGQTINDIQLERVTNNYLSYIEESDSLVQNVNPFFFVEEVKLIDENILRTVYEQVTSVDNAVEEALGVERDARRKKDNKDLESSTTTTQNNQTPKQPTDPDSLDSTLEDTFKTEPALITDFSPDITAQTQGNYTRHDFRIMQTKPAKYTTAKLTEQCAPTTSNIVDASITSSTPGPRTVIPGTKNKKYTDINTNHNKSEILKYKKYIVDAGLSVTDEEWLVFCNTLGLLESDYKMSVTSNDTYIGKYQLSLIALRDLHLIDSSDKWISPAGYTFEKFKSDVDFQEKVFAMYSASNYKYIVTALQRSGSLDLLNSKSTYGKLGVLAAAHFGFMAGVAILRGEDRLDGNRVPASSRYVAVVTALKNTLGDKKTSTPQTGSTAPATPTSPPQAGSAAPAIPTSTTPTQEVKTRKISDSQLSVYSNVKDKSSTDSIGTVLNSAQAPFNSNKQFSVSSGFGRRNGGYHRGIDIVLKGGSIEGEPITPAADGVVVSAFFDSKGGGGNTVIVQHNDLYKTGYCHLSEITCKVGDNVVAFKTVIGKVGGRKGTKGAGRSTGPHLHYSIKYENTFIDPLLILDLKAAVGNTTENNAITPGKTASNPGDKVSATWGYNTVLDETYPVTVYDEGIWLERFIKMSGRNINKGLACGFPTIKVYVTVGNEDNDFLVGETGKIIEFYELRGIRDFHLNTNNQFNPVDVITMVVANPNFIRTDEMTLLSSRPTIDYNSIATDYSTQFKNNMMKLTPGMKLHIRMGYSNNPNNLDIVFNGSVVDTSSITSSSMRVVAEGFGKELLADVIGTTKPTQLGGGWNGSTGSIFADIMLLPSIYHFGKTYSFLRMLITATGGDDTDPEAKTLLSTDTSVMGEKYREGNKDSPRFNLNYYLGFKLLSNVTQRSRIYTNIYSADIEYSDDEFSSPFLNLFANTLFNGFSRAVTYDYLAVKETPWDVMRQMTYRHPGTYVKPLMYEDRCTLFFGIREQMYIARDADKFLMSSASEAALDGDSENPMIDKYIEDRVRRLDPAFNFHIINSEMNLISNEIKLNGNFKTKVNVGYREDNNDITDTKEWETFSMQLDDNLASWEIRSTDLVLSGCDHRYLSYRYGTVKLAEEAETMYEGKIFIIGNSAVKSGDYAYIHDTTRRLFGIIKVRECIHHFDERNGFVTEITPGLFVEPAEFVRSTLFIRLGLMSRIVSEGLITNEIISNAFSTQTFEAVSKYLLIQNEFSKLARPGSDNHMGGFDNLIEVARDDPGLIAWYSLPAGLLALTAWSTINKVVAATRFSYLLTAPILGPSPLAAINKAFADTMGYLATKARNGGAALSTAKAVFQNRQQIFAAGRVAGSFLEFGRIASGRPFASYYLGTAGKTLVSGAWKGIFKITGQGLLRAGILGFRTAALVFGIMNPLAIVATLISQIVISYVTAKLEEEHYTRQPLLLYPLVANSKPYLAGIMGATRNSYWNSLLLEGEKTMHAIRKAATIISNKRALSGKDQILFLNMLSYNASRAKATFAVDENGAVVTNVYANGALLKRGKLSE